MDIFAKSGHKVVYTGEGGYAHDVVYANKYLTVGNEYTIDFTDVGGSHTDVYLIEVDQLDAFDNRISFNSCLFTDETD